MRVSSLRFHLGAAGAVTLLALTGCSAGDTETEPATEPSSLPTFSSTCTDDVGDSTGLADIERVDLRNDGSQIVATLTLSDDTIQPGDMDLSLNVTAWSADGSSGYQFGTKFVDGYEVANFVADLVAGGQENVTNSANFADGTVVVHYPITLLEGLGAGFAWDAAIALAGLDVDFCGSPDARVQVTH